MAILTKEELKLLFETGDKPTQQDFIDLIDTLGTATSRFGFSTSGDFNLGSFSPGMHYPANSSLKLAGVTGEFIESCDTNSMLQESTGDIYEGKFSLTDNYYSGNGKDGNVTISSSVDFSSTLKTNNRTVADGVSYFLAQIATNFVVSNSSPIGISIGDEVMLLNISGVSGNTNNVGNYEFHTVKEIEGNKITFFKDVAKFYGNNGDNLGLGTTWGYQVVIMIRVPNYNSFILTASCSIYTTTMRPIVFRAKTATISGSITATGKGYPGTNVYGYGITGHGGYGGGLRDTSDTSGQADFGGGGGHVTAGSQYASGGAGGAAYDGISLDKLFFGGGGGGAVTPTVGTGGYGGGIIFISSTSITLGATIQANGLAGNMVSGSGGGGCGAGGSIVIKSENYLGTCTINAIGGAHSYITGGTGKSIILYKDNAPSLLGNNSLINKQKYDSSATFVSKNLISGNIPTNFINLEVYLDLKHIETTALIELSATGLTWEDPLALNIGPNLIDLSARVPDNFYYRLSISTTNPESSPIIDKLILNYNPLAYSGQDSEWVSSVIHNADSTPILIKQIYVDYLANVGNLKPKFMIEGSDFNNFDSFVSYGFFQEGSDKGINNREIMNLDTQILDNKIYWRVRVSLNPGVNLNASPEVNEIVLRY